MLHVNGDRGVLMRAASALALSLGLGAAAFAGGPLYVTATANGYAPLRWQGTVQVYTDVSGLGYLGNAKANELVQFSLEQWSAVPTSSFRAQVVGSFDDIGLGDIDGSNAGNVIGTDNGGGLHVIFDDDGSVISDFLGAGFGVLGVATPEFAAASDPTRIVEGWAVIGPQPTWLPDDTGGPVSGVITHELGHAIGLAHSQANGLYAANAPNPIWGTPAGPEQAGPDQCGPAAPGYPSADQVETMYPFISFFPWNPDYNSPGMAVVDVADDMAALSSLYPAPGFASSTGTIKGRIVAKDGQSQLTGINIIARAVDDPLDAISRISGDQTQGRSGPDGSFRIPGLKAGKAYVVYIDELGGGGFSTPKAILLGSEEYWDSAESPDASADNACRSSTITLAAGEVRDITIAVNGIARAPTFTHIPRSLPVDVSDNGQKVLGLYGNYASPYFVWDKRQGPKNIGGSGFIGVISGNGLVVGGTQGVEVESPWGSYVEERAAIWNQTTGWTIIARSDLAGCGSSQSTVWGINGDGSTAVGLAWLGCETAAFRWTRKGGMEILSKVGDRNARANAVSADGRVVGGWDEGIDNFGFRAGSLWQNGEQMLLMDPDGLGLRGYVGEVNAINPTGTAAIGDNAGGDDGFGAFLDSWMWTATSGVRNLGRYKGQFCYLDFDWDLFDYVYVCKERRGTAWSMSDDGRVITGQSSVLNAGVLDATIYTPGMGWMLLSEFLQKQGVLDASRWTLLSARISGNGRTLTGVGLPLAADYWHGYKLELDQVFVCHGNGSAAKTLRVGFPDAMDTHLGHGDRVGLCPGDAPL